MRSVLRMTVSTSIVVLILLCALSCNRKEITQQDKDAASAFYQLAVDAYRNGDVANAIHNLSEAEKYNPQDKLVHNLYGMIYLGKNIFEKAEESFTLAIKLDPAFSDSYNNLGALYIAQKRWTECIEVLKMPEQDLTYRLKTFVFDNLGYCHHMLGHTEEAVRYLKMAVTEHPKNCHAWYNLGKVYRDTGKFVDASNAFQKSIKHCETFIQGWYEYGLASMKADKMGIAKEAFTKCSDLAEGLEDSTEGEACRQFLRTMN